MSETHTTTATWNITGAQPVIAPAIGMPSCAVDGAYGVVVPVRFRSADVRTDAVPGISLWSPPI